MSVKDPYDILGVKKDASSEEIKKAYRRLSLEHHPDRNGGSVESKQRFQEITGAYQKINDNLTKNDNSAQFMGNNAFDLNEMFKFFQQGNFPKQHFSSQMNKPIPIIKTIVITLEQSYSGCSIPVEIERWIIENGVKKQETETLYVQIPKGSDSNEIMIYRNKGNMISPGNIGDVKVIIKLQGHSIYQRHGLDLIYNKNITLKEALCGLSFDIKHLSGKIYKINNARGTSIISPGYQKIVQGLGLSRGQHTGSLVIRFNIIFPQKLSDENIALIEKAL
jgi:DnaJ-class molecular chaperone